MLTDAFRPIFEPKLGHFRVHWGHLLMVSTLGMFLWLGSAPWRPQPFETTYSDFQTLVREGRVERVMVLGDQIHAVLSDPIEQQSNRDPKHHVTTSLPTSHHQILRSFLAEHDVPFTIPSAAKPTRGPV